VERKFTFPVLVLLFQSTKHALIPLLHGLVAEAKNSWGSEKPVFFYFILNLTFSFLISTMDLRMQLGM